MRSCLSPIGPVLVIGPNNFPLAFNSISGGDFAAAIAAGNPVIAKAHPLHPGTTRLLAELTDATIRKLGLPPAMVQLIYHMQPESGLRMVADHRLGATAYKGSRRAGDLLKAAADRAGKPIYLEMSSINPVLILPGALTENSGAIAEQFAASCLMACGQFCTNPGLVIVPASDAAETFLADVAARFASAKCGPMLDRSVAASLADNLKLLHDAGATLLAGPIDADLPHCTHAPALLRIDGSVFLNNPQVIQTEAFGPAALMVVARDIAQMVAIVESLEGNLTGCIYHAGLTDRQQYHMVEPPLRRRVGRLLNNKMPTGVAVSPAMNHGGPYPASGHPGFTAVGLPASMRRFAALHCYDNVDAAYLPLILRDTKEGA